METVIPYALFIIACIALGWAFFVSIAKATGAIGLAIVNKAFSVDFTAQMWVGSFSFTYIMGYIFLY